MVTFPDMVRVLERLGVLDVLVPFLLIFTIIYAILLKTKILGEKKEFNIIIALVFAMAVIIPHVMNWYPPGGDVVTCAGSPVSPVGPNALPT